MATADTIIFDLGGVLIDWNPEYLYRKIFSNENDLRYFLEEICTSAWNQEQNAGYPLAQTTAELAAKYPQMLRSRPITAAGRKCLAATMSNV